MNAKKKNKKAHKPPNPNPPQNLESASKIEPKLEDVQAKCDVKEDILAPEPLCEDLITPVSDIKEVQCDMPKKPKRNKGKNKKNDGDEEEKIISEQLPEVSLQTIVKCDESQNAIQNTKEENPLDETCMVPSARKKKNKKKLQEKTEDFKPPLQETKTPSEELFKIIEKDESDLQQSVSKPETPKDNKKKKNKKKNRTDSEKSDKSENILSCTSAFQKILAEDGSSKQEQSVITSETSDIILLSENQETSNLAVDKKDTKLVETLLHSEEKDEKVKQDDMMKLPKEVKGKKKNKRDKKQCQKDIADNSAIESFEIQSGNQSLELSKTSQQNLESISKLVEESMTKIEKEIIQDPAATKKYEKAMEEKILEQSEKKDDNAQKDPELSYKVKAKNKKQREKETPQDQAVINPRKDVEKQNIEESDDVQKYTELSLEPKSDIVERSEKTEKNIAESHKLSVQLTGDTQKPQESNAKSKAKIAKPVEKRRKDKQENQSTSDIKDTESTLVNIEYKTVHKSPNKLATEEMPTHFIAPDILESKFDDSLKKSPIAVDIPKIELDGSTSKPLTESHTTMDKICVPVDQSMGKKRKKSKSPKPHSYSEGSEKEMGLVESEANMTKSDTSVAIPEIQTIMKSQPGSGDFTEAPEKQDILQSTLIDKPSMPEGIKDNEGYETKTSKKKKKTPKIPFVETTTEMKETVVMTPIKTKEDEACETDIISDINISPDIEIQSTKTESEASSCDVIPEVHFVRSSSQQLFDTNNNTVIEELPDVHDTKLSDIQITPLIQGSGETPIATPELIASGIRVTEIEAKSPPEEKTDIKSKMMEVNQDMEELKLSIERSLAEFSALAKSETDLKMELTDPQSLKEDDTAKDIENKEKDVDKIKTLVKQDRSLSVQVKETEKIEKSSAGLPQEEIKHDDVPPVCPARKDNKGKSKSRKKGKQETVSTLSSTTTCSKEPTTPQTSERHQDNKKENSEQKSTSSQEKGKQQSSSANNCIDSDITNADNKQDINVEILTNTVEATDFEPIENFEDALTSSIDDVNKTFEMIAKDADYDNMEFQKKLGANKPEISITEPAEEKNSDTNKNEKVNPVSQPKNLLGQTDIPAQSNKTDYKKEKNKTPNARQAKVKIKDSSDIETKKQSKESQTDTRRIRKNSDKSVKESYTKVKNDNEEYVYKYSFRKVFLQSSCHVCNKELSQVRVPCSFCNLIFYCSVKHKDEDWPQHQALCFAVSTLAHMKNQKHIYADSQNCIGQDYRLLRMQMIVSCEKVLKRRLVPWEQELMLYPRICAEVTCREWRQNKLKDCEGCGQISYCASNPDHLSKSHARWCKSYSLYQRLVSYQQTQGRLEPRLPTKVMTDDRIPEKMNEVLASMYEEKIDMNDIQYASLTQLATAPLTTAYCLQLCRNSAAVTNGFHKKQPFTIHVVGAELQFEADALNKWETFFLHLRPDVDDLRVVMISPALNPGHLPLHLLGKVKLCEHCQQNKRRLTFKFEDNKNYFEYRTCEDFINPDIICAFNPSIQRSSVYNGKDPWPVSINSILKLKTPFIVTAYTLNELRKDIARIKQISEIDFKFISEPGFNSFASVRPDRNFISDDEMPLLFKNYCVAVIVGC